MKNHSIIIYKETKGALIVKNFSFRETKELKKRGDS